MGKKTITSLFFSFITFSLWAQIGGTSTYQFLTLQPNARIAALGGNAIATPEADVNLTVQNPSLLNKDMNNQVSYNHVFYFADINAGYAGYAHSLDTMTTLGFGLQYINYGTFVKTSSTGEVLGNFGAGEYCFSSALAKSLGKVSVGGQLKFIYSSLEEYNSYGVAIDASATYYNPETKWTFSAVVSNLGRQIKTYTDGNNESLPFNVQLGASKKLKNAPFRFSVVANHLERPGKLVYQNLNRPDLQKDLETGETIPETFNIGDKIMSHITASTELLLGKNVYVAVGYNHLRRWEMKLKDSAGLAGFSWGFGVKISKFQFAYGSSSYLIGRNTNHISFIVYMNEFSKKKKT